MKYNFTKFDINFLHKVYNMRCLTLQQGYDYFYKNKYSFSDYVKTVLVPMQLNKIIKIMPFAGNYAVLLDRNGHDYLRDNFLVKEIIDSDKNKIKKGYNNLGENNMLTRIMNHQVHLNEFVLETEENISKLNQLENISIEYKYSDEKQVSKYLYIRPDGLLSVNITNNDAKDSFDFFLEMDMATETAKQLKHKFIRYNDFVKSKEFYAGHEKILVLFIIANTERLDERKRLIRKVFNEHFNMYNNRFELFIGTKNESLTTLFSTLLNKENPLIPLQKAKQASLVTNIIKGRDLGLESLNRPGYLIRLETGKCFFYDTYLNKPGSVLSKITYYHRLNSDYKLKYNTNIDYLIITDNPLDTLKDLEALEINGTKNIYFTTPERLKQMDLPEAIYMYGYDGSISHFVDTTFTNLKFEKNVKDK